MATRLAPSETATGARPLAFAPFPIWPYVLLPQQYAPPAVRPHEWKAPACTAANLTTSTVAVAVPLFVSALAVIVADPAAAPVTMPDASTVAAPGASLVQVTGGPIRRLPLASIMSARSCTVPPATTDSVGGVTVSDAMDPPPRTAAHVPLPNGQDTDPLMNRSGGVPATEAE